LKKPRRSGRPAAVRHFTIVSQKKRVNGVNLGNETQAAFHFGWDLAGILWKSLWKMKGLLARKIEFKPDWP